MNIPTWYSVLLTPWRVAPHPNRPSKKVSVQQAIALLLEGRLSDYVRYAESDDSLPPLGKAIDVNVRSPNATVLRAMVLAVTGIGEAGSEFSGLALRGKANPLKVFAAIQGAIALADTKEHVRAIELVSGVLAKVPASEDPLGRALLYMQRALRQSDLGQWQRSIEDTDAATALLGQESEPMKSLAQIAELNAWLYRSQVTFDAGEFPGIKRKPLSDMLSRPSLKEAAALRTFVKRRFNNMIVDPYGQTTTWAATDEVETNLWSSLMLAEGWGDFGGSRSARTTLAQYRLIQAAEGEEIDISEPLEMFVRSRDDKSVRGATRRFVSQGPLEPLVATATRAAETEWTTADAKGYVALLEEAADLLAESSHRALVMRLLRLGEESLSAAPEGRLLNFYGHEPFEALARLLAHDHEDVWNEAVVPLLRIDPQGNELIDRAIAACLHAVNWLAIKDDVRAGSRRTAIQWLGQDARRESALIVLGSMASSDPASANALLDDFTSRESLRTAATLVDARIHLSKDIARRIRDLAKARIEKIESDAKKGKFGWGGISAPLILAVLLLRDPHRSDWNFLTSFLLERDVAQGDKEPTLEVMARESDQVPTDVVRRLRNGKKQLLESRQHPFFGRLQPNTAALRLLLAIDAMTRLDALAAITDLVGSGDPVRRIQGTRCLPFARDLLGLELIATIVLNLTRDADTAVRANAAYELASLIDHDFPLRALIEERMVDLIQEPGVSVPLGAVTGLTEYSPKMTTLLLDTVSRIGSSHPSRQVRSLVRSMKSKSS